MHLFLQHKNVGQPVLGIKTTNIYSFKFKYILAFSTFSTFLASVAASSIMIGFLPVVRSFVRSSVRSSGVFKVSRHLPES